MGPYEIAAQIGKGGMGEVYRALDTNLGRQVAIKILPEAFAHDPERLSRLEREAKTLAALNHPNIAQIYGQEKVDGVRALVMELVEGPTLADRIAKGPIPLDEALPIARQIAEALEAAHEQGIIHRDLKPANIKLRPDGTVKVLDFGLAKAFESAAPSDLSESPTMTSPAMTGMGVILGTAAYMSPEQARGKTIDKRADVWAWGCVVYETLTGRLAFAGGDVSETLAAVIKGEPDWSKLPADTPSNIRTLLFRCLQKDIKKRVRDAGDIVIECEQALTPPATSAAALPIVAPVFSRRSLVMGLAGLLLGGFITGLAVWRLMPTPTARVSRVSMNLPPGQRLAGLILTAIAFSPDGKRLAYVASVSGQQQLYLREMDVWDGKPLAGTEGAVSPFFSPDGQWLGFFTFDRLKKVSISGGPPVPLATVLQPRGGSWGSDGNIVFASGSNSGLSVVSEDGATVGSLTKLDRQKGEGSHRLPHHLVGHDALLFTVGTGGSWDDARIELLKPGSGERKVLIEGGSDARYVPTGHIVYLRAGTLMARPFDLGRLEFTGAPVALVQGVLPSTGGNTGAAQAAFADTGSFVYLSGGAQAGERTLVWVDRKGIEEPLRFPSDDYQHPSLSPDGHHVVLGIDEGNSSDVWVYDLGRGSRDRITLGAQNSFPVWTSDGNKVTFTSNKAGGRMNLFWKMAHSSAGEERLVTSENPQIPGSWSADGQTLAFSENDPATGQDIWTLSLKNGGKRQPFVRTPFREGSPAFSLDGRWLAYVSNQTGQYEVYVEPFPGRGRKEPVSTQGGTEPVWSRDGRELFYRSGDKMMVVATTFKPTFEAAKPEVLFERPYYRNSPRNYDVTSDGRFLMIKESEVEATHINLVLNGFEELKRLVPVK